MPIIKAHIANYYPEKVAIFYRQELKGVAMTIEKRIEKLEIRMVRLEEGRRRISLRLANIERRILSKEAKAKKSRELEKWTTGA